ncbi:hypothetical protein [Sphingomonas sp. TREG-RG-20F-R18-01]|uniref:hypothetical protein n=1 Tax=Sphingomonas sp. TREG-RG-20F-R18-01 TaxID=2914982 RepID=UPI001F5AC40D|nr:hypothetical protein [Sphingomonas sp. TREG-RG-20F-R18-01]
MNGDEATRNDPEPMNPDPTHREPLHRAADFTSAPETRRTTNLPPPAVPAGRQISFTAWTLAGVVGIVLWVVIIKLL